MNEVTKILGQIQFLDTRIKSLTIEKDVTPGELAESRKELSEVEQDVQNITAELKDAQMKYKSEDGELSDKLEAIKKFKQQQYEVKTNDAYFALTKEIEEAEFKKLELEESALQLMEKSETLSESLKEKNERLLRERDVLSKLEEKDRERIEALTERISQLQAERASVAEKVDKDLLVRYDKIRESREGLAFVPVRNGSCSGCFIRLPPEVINEVMKGTGIVTCENCARILYWKGDDER